MGIPDAAVVSRRAESPLAGSERGVDEPAVDLGAVLHEIFEEAGWDLRVDYTRPPVPALAPEDAAWADTLLREAGLRSLGSGKR